MNKEITIDMELLAKLYQVCHNAKGLYDLIISLGVKEQLPGYDRCLIILTEAIKGVEDLWPDIERQLLLEAMNTMRD